MANIVEREMIRAVPLSHPTVCILSAPPASDSLYPIQQDIIECHPTAILSDMLDPSLFQRMPSLWVSQCLRMQITCDWLISRPQISTSQSALPWEHYLCFWYSLPVVKAGQMLNLGDVCKDSWLSTTREDFCYHKLDEFFFSSSRDRFSLP